VNTSVPAVREESDKSSRSQNNLSSIQSAESFSSYVLAEYNTLREEMRMFLGFIRRDTQILMVFVGALLAAYASKPKDFDVSFVPMMIPSAIFIYVTATAINFFTVSAQAKACQRIEERVNARFKPEIIMEWETYVVPKTIRNPSAVPTLSGIALALLALSVFLIFAIMAYPLDQYKIISLIHGGEFVVMLIVLVRLYIFNFKTTI